MFIAYLKHKMKQTRTRKGLLKCIVHITTNTNKNNDKNFIIEQNILSRKSNDTKRYRNSYFKLHMPWETKDKLSKDSITHNRTLKTKKYRLTLTTLTTFGDRRGAHVLLMSGKYEKLWASHWNETFIY